MVIIKLQPWNEMSQFENNFRLWRFFMYFLHNQYSKLKKKKDWNAH